jgi:hypothetical protein
MPVGAPEKPMAKTAIDRVNELKSRILALDKNPVKGQGSKIPNESEMANNRMSAGAQNLGEEYNSHGHGQKSNHGPAQQAPGQGYNPNVYGDYLGEEFGRNNQGGQPNIMASNNNQNYSDMQGVYDIQNENMKKLGQSADPNRKEGLFQSYKKIKDNLRQDMHQQFSQNVGNSIGMTYESQPTNINHGMDQNYSSSKNYGKFPGQSASKNYLDDNLFQAPVKTRLDNYLTSNENPRLNFNNNYAASNGTNNSRPLSSHQNNNNTNSGYNRYFGAPEFGYSSSDNIIAAPLKLNYQHGTGFNDQNVGYTAMGANYNNYSRPLSAKQSAKPFGGGGIGAMGPWSPKITESPYKNSANKFDQSIQQLAVINDLRAFRQQVRDRISNNNRTIKSKSRNLSLLSTK